MADNVVGRRRPGVRKGPIPSPQSKTLSERQRDFVTARRAAGDVLKRYWVHHEDVAALDRYVGGLRRRCERRQE